MMPEKKIFQPVLSNNVYQIYEFLHSKGIILFPLTTSAREKVDALVANITGTYYGQEIYASNEDKVVAYFYFLIKNHPFTDGNKRTAAVVFNVLCTTNDLRPNFLNLKSTLDELAIFIERIQEDNHQAVIHQISELLFKS